VPAVAPDQFIVTFLSGMVKELAVIEVGAPHLE
jgi:hypothetical protein